MKHVLHVPNDWKYAWGPTIETVKADSGFKKHHGEYRKLCNRFGTHEKLPHKSLMNIAKAVLDVLSRSTVGDISPKTPDNVVNQKCPRLSKEDQQKNILHILGVDPDGGALCNGMGVSRLVVGGEHATSYFRARTQLIFVTGVDPILNHAFLAEPSQNSAEESDSDATSTAVSELASPSESRKRPVDRSSMSDQPAKKKPRTMPASGHEPESDESDESDDGMGDQTSETPHQSNLAAYACRYLQEIFSTSPLCSYATLGLVDRNRLQLYHGNRSVILLSSAINFSGGDGLNKFIAAVIASDCLSFERHGIAEKLAKNAELVKDSGIVVAGVVHKGNQLEFTEDGLEENPTVDIGDPIYQVPATVGRSTVVLAATSGRWSETKLVVKTSWPESYRTRETDFLEKASEESEKSPSEWAAMHLPRVFHATDVVFDENSPIESVARLFENARFANKRYKYRRRTLRIIVQERLYPVKLLSSVKEMGQVFLDIACGKCPPTPQ
jgi:hypothetical protein